MHSSIGSDSLGVFAGETQVKGGGQATCRTDHRICHAGLRRGGDGPHNDRSPSAQTQLSKKLNCPLRAGPVVHTSAACVCNHCWGYYMRVALFLLERPSGRSSPPSLICSGTCTNGSRRASNFTSQTRSGRGPGSLLPAEIRAASATPASSGRWWACMTTRAGIHAACSGWRTGIRAACPGFGWP